MGVNLSTRPSQNLVFRLESLLRKDLQSKICHQPSWLGFPTLHAGPNGPSKVQSIQINSTKYLLDMTKRVIKYISAHGTAHMPSTILDMDYSLQPRLVNLIIFKFGFEPGNLCFQSRRPCTFARSSCHNQSATSI